MRLTLPFTLVSVVALAAVGGLFLQRQQARPASAAPASSASRADPPLVVDVHVAKPESFQVTVPATGTLLARESVDLVSELSRRLVRVRADEGQWVKKGAVLFELDAAELRAELARLEVQVRLAQTNANRQKALLAEGLTTQAQFDTTGAELEGFNAQRRVLEVTLAKTLIRAPFDGTLGLRRVSEGAWLSPNTVLATLQDTSALKLDFTLPERYASVVAVGREFRFKVSGRAETLAGSIRAFEPAVDAGSRSILVRGLVAEPKGLMPGTFATVELPVEVQQAILVPTLAVVPGVAGRRVFVVRSGVARSVPVELGARTTDRVQILSGVDQGEQVVISNLLRVRDGAKVNARVANAPAPP